MKDRKINLKIVNSLQKCFLDESYDSKPQTDRFYALKGEKLSFQLVYNLEGKIGPTPLGDIKIEGALKDYLTIREVKSVPVCFPCDSNVDDDYFLRKTPGLYPDLLLPLHYENRASFGAGNLMSLWVEINIPTDFPAGEQTLDFSISLDEITASVSAHIDIIDEILPRNEFLHTEWFYADCIAEYYDVPVFSDEHFALCRNFIKTALDNNISVLMVPVITPALDTYIGGERLTTQLVTIKKQNGKYSFDYSLLDRWIDMCLELGLRNFEIPPLFTQWGAKHAPKIMAEVDGEYKKLFGWETDAAGAEYSEFLDAFLPSLVSYLKDKGIDKNCFFHISDEPEPKDFENYKKATAIAVKHLEGYTIIDAVGNLELCKSGGIQTPVVSIRAVKSFLDAGFKNSWGYYCGAGHPGGSNRMHAMPSYRTRIIGVQLYKYDVKGFLHWGFNYYHNRGSYDSINPYMDTSGEYFVPSGDTFLVYPASDGTAYETIRLKLMNEAMQDIALLKLCEKKLGRDFTQGLIQDGVDYEIDFFTYPRTNEYILNLKAKLCEALKNS